MHLIMCVFALLRLLYYGMHTLNSLNPKARFVPLETCLRPVRGKISVPGVLSRRREMALLRIDVGVLFGVDNL